MTTVTAPKAVSATPDERPELVPQYYDTERIVTPDDNPALNPAILAELEPSIRELGQQMPGFVCPSPDLPDGKLLCIEGNHRLAVDRRLGLKFWAFNLGRFVPEAERIRLTFSHNYIRRRMGREEIAERAARFIELTGCTQGEAARLLNVSPPTISRAFGDKRILPHLKARADRLVPTVRSVVAAAPAAAMEQALVFAETAKADGKHPTRDQVAAFIQQLKKADGTPKGRKPKPITLRINGRAVTISVGAAEAAGPVMEDLKAVIAKLRLNAEVPPDGWPFLFQ